MIDSTILVGIIILFVLVTGFFFVTFGQVTVRKLRKNPATKDKLGVEFASGWDILNVAGALSTPKWLRQRFSRSKLSFLVADYQTLYENTSCFDRVLARIFWGFYVASGLLMVILLMNNAIALLY